MVDKNRFTRFPNDVAIGSENVCQADISMRSCGLYLSNYHLGQTTALLSRINMSLECDDDRLREHIVVGYLGGIE